MQTIRVELASRSYDIVIGQDLLAKAGVYCQKLGLGSKLVIISNPDIAELYLDPVQDSLEASNFHVESLLIPEGEANKTLDTVTNLLNQLASMRLDRNSILIALGGGVVGDITGFVAATYLRGINFIQIPTTLLAQVDSSVGGKTGVNLPAGKNLVGCFYQPKLVLIDTTTLETLPERELQTGMAEIIKYGVIRSKELFKKLESIQGLPSADIIAQCCQIKADVVSADEKESYLRMILNFGHTVGHAIEAVTNYQQYTHGEAVALGMISAGKIALALGLFSVAEQQRLIALIEKTGLPTAFPDISIDLLIEAMYRDKKVSERALTFVLPRAIGEVEIVKGVGVETVKKELL